MQTYMHMQHTCAIHVHAHVHVHVHVTCDMCMCMCMCMCMHIVSQGEYKTEAWTEGKPQESILRCTEWHAIAELHHENRWVAKNRPPSIT
jgi:hypothetical protein